MGSGTATWPSSVVCTQKIQFAFVFLSLHTKNSVCVIVCAFMFAHKILSLRSFFKFAHKKFSLRHRLCFYVRSQNIKFAFVFLKFAHKKFSLRSCF